MVKSNFPLGRLDTSLDAIRIVLRVIPNMVCVMGVWQGVAMDSRQFYQGPPCLTLLCPVGGPSLKRPYSRFRGGLPAGQVACGSLLLIWTSYAVRLWCACGGS
jgi:hypothetical protein